MSKKILGWSLIDALGTLAYIGFVVGFISNAESIFGNEKTFVIPIAMLLLFVLSASVTGGLVLGRPLLWYWAGEKTGAVKLFAATLAWIAIFFVMIILGYYTWRHFVL